MSCCNFERKTGQMKTVTSMLQGLTFDDLREWAGEKIFNRGRN